MSVRRLADDHVQPDGFAFNRENAAWAKATIKKYPKGREQSAVIPLLMRAQDQEGWVTRSAIESIADMLDMPYIRALEVATFYTQFQLKPVGSRAHVQVCGTTPCMLRGSEDLMNVCRKKIHPEPFHLNEEGTLSWEEVECQGACVNAPMIMIFKDTYEDLSPERLAYIIDRFGAGKGHTVETGPQIDRVFSAPDGGPTTLLSDETDNPPSDTGAAADEEASVAPTKAARPSTDAPETNPNIKSPSDKKVDSAAEDEKTAGKEASKAAKASKAGDSVSGSASASGVKGTKSEHSQQNPTMKLAGTAKSTRPKKTASDDDAIEANQTMKLARSAKGGGKPVAKADKPAKAEESAEASSSDKGRPTGMDKPADPDNLRWISGVGPKIEGILHDLGIWKWSQVASWKKAERDWVDDYLKFKGRIEREDWVKQAKALAKGGEEEYVRVFGKKPR